MKKEKVKLLIQPEDLIHNDKSKSNLELLIKGFKEQISFIS